MSSSAIPLLRQARTCANALVSQSLQVLNLTFQQYVVLEAIAQHPTTNLQTVMLHTGYERRECEIVIRKLHNRGYVEHHLPQQHSRRFELRCTNLGLEAVTRADNMTAEVNLELMNAIEPVHREKFLRMLSYIVAKRLH